MIRQAEGQTRKSSQQVADLDEGGTRLGAEAAEMQLQLSSGGGQTQEHQILVIAPSRGRESHC